MKEQLCKIDLPEIEGFEDAFEFRKPKKDEYYRNGMGCTQSAGEDNKGWILRKSQEWVTPTDEDAKGRPEVEVRAEQSNWFEATLVLVDRGGAFHTVDREGYSRVFLECRMKKELRK